MAIGLALRKHSGYGPPMGPGPECTVQPVVPAVLLRPAVVSAWALLAEAGIALERSGQVQELPIELVELATQDEELPTGALPSSTADPIGVPHRARRSQPPPRRPQDLLAA